MKPLAFTHADAQAAADEWGFNCGPAAACAVLGKTPAEIRPLLGDFEAKRYTNPSLMYEILQRACVGERTVYRGEVPHKFEPATNALVRVQWGGSWTHPGVPMGARYRRTHWVAIRGTLVFDVNAVCVGGWMPLSEWETQLMPWLGREVVPGWDGRIWPTHVIEVKAPSSVTALGTLITE